MVRISNQLFDNIKQPTNHNFKFLLYYNTMTTFDLNKFNAFLDTASKTILCDSECQKNQQAEKLKATYMNSESNLLLAEPQYQTAKQNYYTFISGQNGYNEMMETELKAKSTELVAEFKSNYDTEIDKIKTQIDTYNGLLINFKNVVELYNKYKIENIKLEKEVKNKSNDVLTNDRKTFYEEQQSDSLDTYYRILFTIYVILILCFVVFSFKYSTTLAYGKKIVLGIILILLPFVSTFLLGKCVQILYFMFTLLPKNVYT